MKKKSNDELGSLLTREMKAMMLDEDLTKEQKFEILAYIVHGVEIADPMLRSHAKSLKAGYEAVNKQRLKSIDIVRKSKREHERRQRELGYIWENRAELDKNGSPSTSMEVHGMPWKSMECHGRLKQNKTSNISPPYIPPKGGGEEEKIPSAITPEELAAGMTADPAEDVACAIERSEAFSHARTNGRKLRKVLRGIFKKNAAGGNGGELASQIKRALKCWEERWKEDDWRYIPGKLTDWLADEKWLQEPRKKNSGGEGGGMSAGCGVEVV